MVLVVIHPMGSAHVSDERERQRTNGKCVETVPIVQSITHLTTPTRHVMVGIIRTKVIVHRGAKYCKARPWHTTTPLDPAKHEV